MDSEFYRKFSHDILNITGRMQSIASLLDPQDPPSAEDLAMARNLINRDSDKLNTAIRLFCLTQWLGTNPAADEKDFELSMLLQEVANQYLETPEKPVLLNLDTDNAPGRTKCQQDVLRFLLDELVKNAVTHSADSTSVDIHAAVHNGRIDIEISNTPLAPLPEGFSQPLTTRPESPGMGLGLPFALKAAEHLGGTLDLQQDDNFVKARLSL